MSDEERRKHDEIFRFKIIEQQAEIKALISETKEGIHHLKESIAEHGIKITNIESAIWGYPKSDSIGLLENHRKMARNWVIVGSVCAFIFSAFGKSAAPLIEKFITDWSYNSVSERWLRQQKRPRVRIYKIYPKKEVKETPKELPNEPVSQ